MNTLDYSEIEFGVRCICGLCGKTLDVPRRNESVRVFTKHVEDAHKELYPLLLLAQHFDSIGKHSLAFDLIKVFYNTGRN